MAIRFQAVGAFDIDGTLLHHQEKPDFLSETDLAKARPDIAVCKRIATLIEAGVAIHFITGRCHPVKSFTITQLRCLIHPSIQATNVHTQDEFRGYPALAEFKARILEETGAQWFVGDHACDEAAAKAAKIPFQFAEEYSKNSVVVA